MGGLGRARIDTTRGKLSYIHASATDGRYIFTATVPDNKNKTKFVISKALMVDWTLSGEFEPVAEALKDGRKLDELYVTDKRAGSPSIYWREECEQKIVKMM